MKTNNQPEITLRPVGFVSSPIKKPVLHADKSGLKLDKEEFQKKHGAIKGTICELTMEKELQDLLDGLEEFSHALIIYWPHLLKPERRKLQKVHPMGRKDLPLTGIFATRSPARPNPLLVSVVRIIERNENKLTVLGLEAVDGSPILDIKPHMKAYDSEDTPKVAPWMQQIEKELEADL